MRKKINGGPGTGKTHFALGLISEQLDIGGSANFLVETYRRRLANDIISRVMDIYGVGRDEFEYVTTTHGICKRLIELTKDQIVLEKHRNEFCEQLGLEYKTSSNYDEWYDLSSVTKGGTLFSILTWSVNVLKPLKYWHRCSFIPSNIEIREEEIIEFDGAWRDYKAERGLFDFDDMLKIALEDKLVPEVDIYFADEFQDKTPLQYKLFELWSDAIEDVVVAGDPNQTIYDFAGCTPGFFLNLDYEEEDLKTSYRLPANHYAFARKILSHDTLDLECQPDGILQRIGEEGFLNHIDAMNEDGKARAILLRTNYQVKSICDTIEHLGIPFIGKYGWRTASKNLLSLIKRIQGENILSFHDLCYLLNNFKREAFTCEKKRIKGIKDKAGSEEPEMLSLEAYLTPLFISAVTKNAFSSWALKGAFQRCVRVEKVLNSGFTQPPESIYVGTIHSAKGLEWDVVYLFTSIPKRVYDATSMNREREERLFYVASTRAKKALYLVEDYSASCVFHLPQFEEVDQ